MVFGHWCVSRLSHNSQILFLLTMFSSPVCENLFEFICKLRRTYSHCQLPSVLRSPLQFPSMFCFRAPCFAPSGHDDWLESFIILLFARRTLFFVLGIHPCRGLLVVANTLHLVLVLVAHPPPPRHHCCYPSPHFNFPSRLHQLPSAT
ncbi:hypothetical protein BC835DRAFT_1350019 [Cytidiella melzeri]|nr:hypothetical protein BC835DRAFT_1350019 [Cytidiella melzeri]